MKVLIITYYWPPAGGSGVQRWLKFAKYFPDFDIKPIIYTPENPNYPTQDKKLLDEVSEIEVLKKSIFNPQDIFSFSKKTNSGVANVSKGGILSWIRGNFFIPDAKIFWVNPSVKFLTQYVKENNIDVVISSGPPHSMHLIAKKIKQKTNIKWIADFRDPWTTLYYAEDFNLTNLAKNRNKKLETEVLKLADAVTTVSNTIAEELAETSKNVHVISNGYDDEVLHYSSLLDTKFSIAHIGLLPRQSNPSILWEALHELTNEVSHFKENLQISLTGNVNSYTLDELSKWNLESNVLINGYVSHQKAIELQKSAQVLLLLIPKTTNSKGILTGKVFEYITSKRPILAIGNPDGDLASLLFETNTGIVIDFEDKQALKTQILYMYELYINKKLNVTPHNIEQFHRKNLTGQFSKLIKQL